MFGPVPSVYFCLTALYIFKEYFLLYSNVIFMGPYSALIASADDRVMFCSIHFLFTHPEISIQVFQVLKLFCFNRACMLIFLNSLMFMNTYITYFMNI